MSKLDQCPSSKKQGLPVDKAAGPRERSHATGKTYWRSLDDLAQTPEFKDFLHREFPANASELLSGSRRDFLKIMSASVALAGAATIPGCRRPDHKIIAYNRKPEEVIHGKPLFYATSRRRPGGGVDLLLAETFDGRPTKLEGNPLDHPTGGALTMHSQASILDLYDPDRSPDIIEKMAESRGKPFKVRRWREFMSFAGEHFAQYDQNRGRGLSFLVEKVSSPSRDRLRDAIRTRWPEAKWLPYSAMDNAASIEGTQIAFGAPKQVEYVLSKADVIVSLDCDFLGGESTLEGLRGYGRNRIREGAGGREARDTKMSRIYSADSQMSLTGGQSDHRLNVHVDAVGAVAIALAEAVLNHEGLRGAMRSAASGLSAAIAQAKASAGSLEQIKQAAAWAKWAADDLVKNRGRSVVMPGRSQPAAVHALAAAINHALDNDTLTVQYRPMVRDLRASSVDSVKSVVDDANSGVLQTLVTIGVNPVFSAPADLDFAIAIAKVPNRIHLGDPDETAEASTMFVGRTHFLEEWNDAEAPNGTRSICQPMIKPLYDYHSDIEFLAAIMGEANPDGYTIVRDTMERTLQPRAMDVAFRRALHDGIVPETRDTVAIDPLVAPRWQQIASAIVGAAPGFRTDPDRIDVLMLPDPHVLDGQMANNGWLQELPGAVTKVAWSNPAIVNMATAKKLGLRTGKKLVKPQYSHTEVMEIEHEGRTVRCPIWVMPGVPDNQIIVTFGQGRRVSGRIGEGTGYDLYPLRSTGSMSVARGVKAGRARGVRPELIPNTQDHWVMEGRDIIREVDLEAWKRHGDMELLSKDEITKLKKDAYGNKREVEDIKFANRLGMESHTPVNRDSYRSRQQQRKTYVQLEDDKMTPKRDARGRILGAVNGYGKRVQQWGMSIDLTSCVGCGACTVACQAENNIPIVGPKEVAKGREMQWMRIDRYFGTGTDNPLGDSDPKFFTMPVTCVHCENAPCEVVCPVNATVHGSEGTNNMAYNRCIGTRYCSNNCPYKVRRFNYFDYGTKQFRGGFGQVGEPLAGLPEHVPDALKPASENFIPPRLREKKLEVATLQYNPHVTVRSRGLMEKCTYCIQRVNAARVETKLQDLEIIPDGFFKVACEQACPTGAIVFGDIYDYSQYRDDDGTQREGSRVSLARNSQRSYALLAYLNTRPRTTYKIRIQNPNPDWLEAEKKAGNTDAKDRLARWENPFHHDDHSGDHHSDGHSDDHSNDHGEEHSRLKRFSLPVLDANGVELA
ncbi:MAG: TAT-variant-translocated molybdopterin oxidoreductase [Phycisphaerales bacterium JB050]